MQVASSIERATVGMTSKQSLESVEVKTILENLIQPVTTWICGDNETLNSSKLPDAWKILLRGIDDAIIQWAKNFEYRFERNSSFALRCSGRIYSSSRANKKIGVRNYKI